MRLGKPLINTENFKIKLKTYKEYIKASFPVSPVTKRKPICKVSECINEAEGYIRYEAKHPQHGHGIECIRTSKRCKKHFK